MTSGERARIKDILDKEEYSIYDATELMDHLAKLLKQTPLATIKEASEGVRDEVNTMIGQAKDMLAKLAEVEANFDTAFDTFWDDTDKKLTELYNKVRDAKERVARKLDGLPKLQLPSRYDTDALAGFIGVVERLDGLTEAQVEKAVRVFSVFADRG